MFDFGANWKAYSANVLDESRLEEARNSIAELLGEGTVEDKTFADIGFGSGIFAIAAAQLGAAAVLGLDVNAKCVDAAQANAERFLKNAAAPRFLEGSILAKDTVRDLGRFDVVYAWGSLHHTGSMWEAIESAARLVAPGGTLAIAIYNRHVTSPVWRVIKRCYNASPGWVRRLMYWGAVPVIVTAKFAATGKNPFNKRRGMDFFVDVIDWIGGYPYEYASIDEVVAQVEALGFDTVKTVAGGTPIACNEFVFRYTLP